ncbi:MAG: alpha-amylase family glycosyl hydrolase [Chloroflexota bacterium]
MKTNDNLWKILLISALSLSLFSFAFPGRPAAAYSPPSASNLVFPHPATPNVTNWCLAGSFQGWNNASDPLNDDGLSGDLFADDGVFSLAYTVATAGRHEWKIVECGNWGNAYPANNAWLLTSAANQVVKFTFDTNDHSGDAGAGLVPAQNIVNAWDDAGQVVGGRWQVARGTEGTQGTEGTTVVGFTAVGDFQGWNNSDPNTALTHVGNGLYRLAYTIAAPGSYIGKVTQTGSWGEQYGADGRSVDGVNLSFTTTTANETIIVLLDTRSGRLTITPNGSGAGNWCVAGGFQGWNNASDPLNDNGVNGDLLGGDGVYSLDYTIASSGRHEWKIVECGNWGNAYPANNAWANTSAANQVVKFTFDTNDHGNDAGLDLLPAQNIVNAWDDVGQVAGGRWQVASTGEASGRYGLDGPEYHPPLASPLQFTAVGDFQGWNNSDPNTALTSLGNGWHSLDYAIASAGNYIGKITSTGSWDAFGGDGRSIDAANLSFQVFSDNDVANFILDSYDGRLAIITPPPGGAGHDNNIFWDDLGHDSRDTLYRTPGAAVPTGTAVTVRLRAASNDLTAAQVRLWNDRLDSQSFLNMSLAADDGTYEWWEATLPASTDPTIYWYRFIAIDGTATAYYEDDALRNGGWGQTFGDSPDNSWQLSVYDPSFQTPEWVKNGVIYQIFADRFRDDVAGNNTPVGSFFYDTLAGTIQRSTQSDWNTPICDPRDGGSDCPGQYSENFYGGDLQGITNQLDYLQGLGVTVLYLNPIFESPSNHKYDTTDYGVVDDNFGGDAAFQTLMTEAHNRGMKVILDGVFNHTSSDSVYFDRYGSYPVPDGACESETSPYRGWYFFQPAPIPGSGPCAGDTTYTSWFGFDSLPKLDSVNTEVRDLIWSGGSTAVGRYWMQWADGWRLDVGGDVDPGVTNDPNNDYWEGFRDAVHTTKPDAYIVGEEWNVATAWTLGREWDATMNYQFSSAILSFWRDEVFVDNDHNSGSSAGTLSPLTPSQLDGRLHNLAERYPPEAFYALMNLLGSHDTNRALFMLDHNTDLNDRSIYENPAYDWSDAITRLKGVVLLQMTLPGAPTIYYGDEVGLVGPVTYDGSTWQDDPYNRLPYPWLDESGTPFYTHLQTPAGQDNLRSYYALLATTRNAHPALRTGSLDTLLVDDTNNLYAYGRKLANHSDAAVVIVNRAGGAQDVTVDVSGYLPVGGQLQNAFNPSAVYTIDANGLLTVSNVPALSGAVLVATGPLAQAPAAVTDLAVTAERSNEVDLDWSGAAGATSYDVYRSLVSGGGYSLVANTTATNYTDTGLQNAVDYYYVVVGRDDATLLVSGDSNEVRGIPHHDLTTAWYNLQWPYEIFHTISTTDSTDNIYGQLYIAGATGADGPAEGITAQVGYGAVGTLPTDSSWLWTDMAYNAAVGNNDEYVGNLLPEYLGDYDYTTRYSSDGGLTWFYADRDGPGYDVGRGGLLHVLPGSDTTPPAAPANLVVTGTTPGSISLAWDANSEPDLAGYEIYRQDAMALTFTRLVRLGLVTSYTDTSVVTDQSYDYYVLAYDTSFNRSAASNIVTATAEARLVAVTFNVDVPGYTPGTVYIVGSIPEFGSWNPGAISMTQVDGDTWTITLSILDGTAAEFKFTRGSWETVEKEADGNTEIANRPLTVDYGPDGTQVLDLVAANWRDPIVASHDPAAGATGVPVATTISATWNQAMNPATDFTVTGPEGAVAGAFSYDAATYTTIFTPTEDLWFSSVYTVTATGESDAVGDVQQAPAEWTFTTEDCPANCMRSAGIVLAGQRQGANVRILGAVRVLDGNGARVAGATVYATWTLPDASTVEQTAVTTPLGIARFRVIDGLGTYTLTITDIAQVGYTFDPANSVLSKSITTPPGVE